MDVREDLELSQWVYLRFLLLFISISSGGTKKAKGERGYLILGNWVPYNMGEIKPWRKGVLLPLPRELSREGKQPSNFHVACCSMNGEGLERTEWRRDRQGVYDLT